MEYYHFYVINVLNKQAERFVLQELVVLFTFSRRIRESAFPS